MQEIAAERSRARTLPIILIAALAQGWGLYFLDLAIRTDHWPATDPAWLIGLDAVAIFAPMTVQLLVEHARRTSHWVFGGLMAAATFYFGWHYGTFVENRATLPWHYFSLGFVLTVLWLLVLPFAQSALDSGWLNFEYRSLFTNAWRNKIALAEAAIFTGLFWL